MALAAVAANTAAAGTNPAGTGPASTHPATHAAKHAARQAAKHAKVITAKPRQRVDPVKIVSQYAAGEYVSIVTCRGTGAPPPLRLKAPGTPLTLTGTGPSAGVLQSLAKPGAYKNVYTCTIVIKKRVPPAPREATLRQCELGHGGGTSGTGTGGTGGARTPVCHETVTLNTGFGGEARAVASHHPAG
jgi:hypothetical protein